jgi:hypothetical protein
MQNNIYRGAKKYCKPRSNWQPNHQLNVMKLLVVFNSTLSEEVQIYSRI